jgi:hypothetical protein
MFFALVKSKGIAAQVRPSSTVLVIDEGRIRAAAAHHGHLDIEMRHGFKVACVS